MNSLIQKAVRSINYNMSKIYNVLYQKPKGIVKLEKFMLLIIPLQQTHKISQ